MDAFRLELTAGKDENVSKGGFQTASPSWQRRRRKGVKLTKLRIGGPVMDSEGKRKTGEGRRTRCQGTKERSHGTFSFKEELFQRNPKKLQKKKGKKKKMDNSMLGQDGGGNSACIVSFMPGNKEGGGNAVGERNALQEKPLKGKKAWLPQKVRWRDGEALWGN